ncbi:MAG: tetratricopeptide repeat protein [Planctomycetes bacterium]|nr:tetratricopeptide repeat protein [Planctomycetota bacterium]
MNEALQRWREEFERDPGTALDRLARGFIPLGAAGPLSLGDVLDFFFEPADSALDSAVECWLDKHILAALPDGTTLNRWVAVLEEFFRGIAPMELPNTGKFLRRQHKRLRLWLHGFYQGPDRDPEGAYLFALARAQRDRQFSPLWRRLILGEEPGKRSYLGIGILGFRKMPDADGRESADVPQGLLEAMMELADKGGISESKWKQTMRSVFATYRRTAQYWVNHLAPIRPNRHQPSKARDWLSALLPGLKGWRPSTGASPRRVQPVPVYVSKDWAERLRKDPAQCDSREFAEFLDWHRSYAELTGFPNFINKTFNNVAMSIIRADRKRAPVALSLMEEALQWAPWNPRNWTSYARVLHAARRDGDAVSILWEARHRFAWDHVIRSELGVMLREQGDWTTSEYVLREAVAQFPTNVVCRNGLAETLRAMDRLDEARAVYEETVALFPENDVSRSGWAETLRAMGRREEARAVYEDAIALFPTITACRTGLGNLLLRLGEPEEAIRLFREALEIERDNTYAKAGLARGLATLSATRKDTVLRDEAKSIITDFAKHGNQSALLALEEFDSQWERAQHDPNVKFRALRIYDTEESPPATPSRPDRAPMSTAAPAIDDTEESPPIAPSQPDRAPMSTAALGIDDTEETPPATPSKPDRASMSTAERLGRAMIALWRAERETNPSPKSALCDSAEAFLNVPEHSIEDDLLPPFVETQGLVKLARGNAKAALAYFEEQIRSYGRGGWAAVRIGQQRVRILLGEADDADNARGMLSSESARFAWHVARVIQTLSGSAPEAGVRALLKDLYPRSAEIVARAERREQGVSFESGEEMVGAFLGARWFKNINTAEDLDQPENLRLVVERIRASQTDMLDVISNSTLALAA